MGLDAVEVFLPDIGCRYFERRSARWPAADGSMEAKVQAARAAPPKGGDREVTALIRESGKLLGYAGVTAGDSGYSTHWVERRQGVWRDVRNGYGYFVRNGDKWVAVECDERQGVQALNDGTDLLTALPESDSATSGIGRLRMVETYPDLYLAMREAR